MNIWLAPLHGITYFYFRNTFIRHFKGIDFGITPFVPVQETTKLNVRKWKDFLPENNRDLEIIPQLMGTQPSHFRDTIHAMMSEFGFTRFNWNIGCPMPQIVRKKRGCGILAYPEMVQFVMDEVLAIPNCRFSIKMRLGLSNPHESVVLLEQLRDYPLDFIVIHPRIGLQQYEGTVDLQMFEQLLSIATAPVVYSGDIWSVDVFRQLSARFPMVENWMLGRGLLRNPFLAEEIINPDYFLSQQMKTVRFLDFYQDLIQTYREIKPDSAVLSNLKELWHYFSYLNNVHQDYSCLLRINDLDEFLTATREVLANSDANC